MSKFDDIRDGSLVSSSTKFGMVYTCNCGWLDLGHANPTSSRANVGATNLWATILGETGEKSPNALWHRVRLNMKARKFGLEMGVEPDHAVKLGLTLAEKESVALAIFAQASTDFEAKQNLVPDFISDSGFSGEDLVSNLAGFYGAVRGVDYVAVCRPVSRAAAEKVWTDYGAPGETRNKNNSFRPITYPCSVCDPSQSVPMSKLLPAQLSGISAAPIGALYRVWDVADLALTAMPAPTPPTPPAVAPAAAPAAQDKIIAVVKGTTLSGIAGLEYLDWRYWSLLWDCNRDAVGANPNRLKLGISLRVPPLSKFSSIERENSLKRAHTWKVFPR